MAQPTHELILASESPRRKNLLETAGFKFTIFPVKVSEYLDKNLNVNSQILQIAERKLQAAIKAIENSPNYLNIKNYLVLTADTMVVLDGKPIGKPVDEADAILTLRQMSSRDHDVKTAMYLYESSEKKVISHLETTTVFFRKIPEAEIQAYVASKEPLDKAGSYGIQGEGRKFVQSFVGSFNNIVGLPVEALKEILKKNNWSV